MARVFAFIAGLTIAENLKAFRTEIEEPIWIRRPKVWSKAPEEEPSGAGLGPRNSSDISGEVESVPRAEPLFSCAWPPVSRSTGISWCLTIILFVVGRTRAAVRAPASSSAKWHRGEENGSGGGESAHLAEHWNDGFRDHGRTIVTRRRTFQSECGWGRDISRPAGRESRSR